MFSTTAPLAPEDQTRDFERTVATPVRHDRPSGLTHAYGSAQDVPARIKALVAPDADVRSAALGELFSSICHQGTVCTASAPAIPFLARALVCAPGERALIGLLMALMCRQYGEDWSDPSTRSGAVPCLSNSSETQGAHGISVINQGETGLLRS
jgi:hypothetical protein